MKVLASLPLLFTYFESVQAVPPPVLNDGLVAQGFTNYCLPTKTMISYEKQMIFNNRCLCSDSGRYEFCLWGNELMLWDDQVRSRIWSAENPTDREVYLTLTYGGTLTLRNRWNDKLVWTSDDEYMDPFLSSFGFHKSNNGATLHLLEEGIVDIVKNDKILWSIPDNSRSSIERISCLGKILQFGGKLTMGQYICSNEDANEGGLTDDSFAFGLNSKGHLVLYYASNDKFYTIFNNDSEEVILTMQGDGNLVLSNQKNEVLYETSTGDNFGAHLTIDDDGAVKIKSMEGCKIWAEAPNDGCVTGPLKAGNSLNKEEYLCFGNYRFGMDSNGDLSWWNWGSGKKLNSVSNTSGTGEYAMMQKNGNLVVRNKRNKLMWNSGTYGNIGSVLLMTGSNKSDINIKNLSGDTMWKM